MDWTDTERKLVVECAYHMTEITGHNLSECIKELHALIRDYRSGKADEYGMEKE